MEELLDALPEPGLAEGGPDTSGKGAVSHANLYKSRPAAADPESRRKDFLQSQKEKRWDMLKFLRNLTEEDEDDVLEKERGVQEDAMFEAAGEQGEQERKDGQEPRKRSWRERGMKKHAKSIYADHLMQSEWMVDVPEDLEEQWLVKLCPEGQRRLVVAHRGTTKVFTKTGRRDRRFLRQGFHSYLPGGSLTRHLRAHTVLDCLYVEKERTFYMLDPIAWNNLSFYESETEFRFFWLDQKTRETPEICRQSKANPYRFIPLPTFPFTLENLEKALASSPFKVDGVLFFHKATHYTLGITPLVLWLKPFMLTEVLGLPVSELYRASRPPGYTDYSTYIATGSWAQHHAHGRKKCRKGDNSMEIVESDSAGSLPSSGIETTRDHDLDLQTPSVRSDSCPYPSNLDPAGVNANASVWQL